MQQHSLGFLEVSAEDEEAYRILLRRGEAGRDDLARQLARDGELLSRRLTGLGLARESGDGVLHPVSPARAVEYLVEDAAGRLRSRLEARVSASGTVDSLLAEREALTRNTDGNRALDMIQRLEGMAAVRETIDELTFFTWTESLTTNPGGVLSPDTIAHARPLDERILRRGVHMRTLLGAAALDDPATMAYARELISKGAQIRISAEPLERLIICDRAAALTPIDPTHTAKGALLIRELGLVAALASLFERMWNTAQELPPDEAGDGPAEHLTAMERRILQALFDAEKDENGARDLGIAVRTYRKYVAMLMQRLGASNRFQAALLARERGWI
ncbi:LuxR C-terminal-related transcriptional regulator [Kitasatospora sp. NPDC089509]|uniref:LuxR C-terminal-related transcriptional regulator n=1 Tax=Kitasatospora sp. NPDC089509 TaxID=3364079 RepID=UPI0037FC36D2